jgi:hypothetical protein
MSNYDPLREYLLFSGKMAVTMTFAEIERVLGRPLPVSARKRSAWWSNNSQGHVQADAWLNASYKASDLDLALGQVSFILDLPYSGGMMDSKQSQYRAAGMKPPTEVEPSDGKRIHPAFGSLRGTTIVAPGYDLTLPTSLLTGDEG